MYSLLSRKVLARLKPRSSAEELHAAEVTLVLQCTTFAVTTLCLVVYSFLPASAFFWAGLVIAECTCVGVFAAELCLGRMSEHLTVVTLLLWTVAVVLVDWANAAVPGAARVWPLVVLLSDWGLVIRMRSAVLITCLAGILVWLAISAAEDAFRLGLYDKEGVAPESLAHRRVSCDDPPCPLGFGSAYMKFVISAAILMVDFKVTRGFATGQRRERENVQLSVAVAERIAAALSLFDLDTAEEALAGAGDRLPPELRDSFDRLLGILAGYKPYLPMSCLPGGGGLGDEADVGSSSTGTSDTPSAAAFVARTISSASLSTVDGHSRVTTTATKASDPPAKLARPSHHVRVTLLVVNRLQFLDLVRRMEFSTLCDLLQYDVSNFVSVVTSQRGVTDILSGDHLYANFGAARGCRTHRLSATNSACTLCLPSPQLACESPRTPAREARMTAAVCSGSCKCGDFGSASAQRFMVVGPCFSMLCVVERLSARWEVPVLVDGTVEQDVNHAWYLRLRQALSFPKTSAAPTRIWEVMSPVRRASNPAEWMYELSGQSNPWYVFNTLLSEWIVKGAWQEIPQPGDETSAVVAEHIRNLSNCVGDARVQPVLTAGAETVGLAEKVFGLQLHDAEVCSAFARPGAGSPAISIRESTLASATSPCAHPAPAKSDAPGGLSA
eukprot:TRINITY_DN39813_c0_g1_i1.p1 TRINITY_DN39813_c0_g1~~TRINITY_DN39813_c0_g1_i1.p1  ORF type:complete len:695 (+),score=190.98 TRINITY_DN39813_c0_g1_i1:76-2085(+)